MNKIFIVNIIIIYGQANVLTFEVQKTLIYNK